MGELSMHSCYTCYLSLDQMRNLLNTSMLPVFGSLTAAEEQSGARVYAEVLSNPPWIIKRRGLVVKYVPAFVTKHQWIRGILTLRSEYLVQ